MNIQIRLANYITRYAPSHKKIRTYLQKKKIGDIDKLLQEIRYDESLMCDMWMRSFVSLGKGKREMLQKLYKKEFPKDMIEEKISFLDEEIIDWDMHKNHIERQIETLLERGKSVRSIAMIMVSRYPYFRDEITEYMESSEDTHWLQKEVQKYKNKYNTSIQAEKQKLYAALMRKWFGYQEIKDQLAINN